MAYCKNCGAEIADQAVICPHCGVQVQEMSKANHANDNGGFGWGLLGFCFPIVGLILFLVWKNDKPNNAKAAGIGALVGFVLNMLTVIVTYATGNPLI